MGAILYLYAGYPLLLVVLGSLRRERQSSRRAITPDVSLIISAYNEERVIRDKILNSLALDYPPAHLEIVLASDGSTDSTTAIAREYAPHGLKILEFPARRGKNAALNDVVPQASGDIIVFTDANGKFQKDALHKLVEHFADPSVGCVCGELIYLSAADNLVARGYNIYWRYDQALKRLESRLGCLLGANGSIFAIRKALYRPLPGQVSNDMVSPIHIAARGHRVIYEPEAISLEAGSQDATEELGRRSRIVGRGILGIHAVLPEVLRSGRPLLLWELMSKKLLRYCTPFLFLLLAASNSLLWTGIYGWMLLAQGLFYLLGSLGVLLRRHGLHFRLLSVPHYFLVGNAAALSGWAKVLAGRELTKWETVQRSYDTRIPSPDDASWTLSRR